MYFFIDTKYLLIQKLCYVIVVCTSGLGYNDPNYNIECWARILLVHKHSGENPRSGPLSVKGYTYFIIGYALYVSEVHE